MKDILETLKQNRDKKDSEDKFKLMIDLMIVNYYIDYKDFDDCIFNQIEEAQ